MSVPRTAEILGRKDMPTDGNWLPIEESGDFGASPFFEQFSLSSYLYGIGLSLGPNVSVGSKSEML
jgi:hypothetical protein